MNSDQQSYPATTEQASPMLQLAINKFNAGDYFVCHEFLEQLWLDEQGPQRDLYKGILQIGIGLRHLQRNNINGARRLLENGSNLIEPFTPVCFGIDLLSLQNDARSVLLRLEEPNQAHRFMDGDAIQITTC